MRGPLSCSCPVEGAFSTRLMGWDMAWADVGRGSAPWCSLWWGVVPMAVIVVVFIGKPWEEETVGDSTWTENTSSSVSAKISRTPEEKTQKEGEIPGRDWWMGTAWLVCLAGRNAFHALQKDRRVSIQLCWLLCESRKRKTNMQELWWLLGHENDEQDYREFLWQRERWACSIDSCEALKCHRQVVSLEKLKSTLHFRGRNNRRPHFHRARRCPDECPDHYGKP